MRHTVKIGGEKSHPLFEFELFLLSMTTLSASVSSGNVPLVWLDIVAKTQRHTLTDKNIQQARTFLRAFQILCALAVGVSLVLKGNLGYFLAGITSLLSQVGIIVIYFVGHRWLSALIKSVTKDRHSFVLRRMKVLTKIVLYLMPISCISSVAYAMFNIFGTENFCAAGRLCVEVLSADLIVFICKSLCASCS